MTFPLRQVIADLVRSLLLPYLNSLSALFNYALSCTVLLGSVKDNLTFFLFGAWAFAGPEISKIEKIICTKLSNVAKPIIQHFFNGPFSADFQNVLDFIPNCTVLYSIG